MRSCIATLYLSVAFASGLVVSASGVIDRLDALVAGQVPSEDPDALYQDRENLASAKRATEIWAKQLASNPKAFSAAKNLAKARYWLGTNGLPEAERKSALEAGVAAARTAITIDAQKPDGHFWLAANMGALAESFGLRQGIKYRGEIRAALETVLKLDPAFQQGSAERALGRWYFRVPGLFGGSNKKSEEYLRKSLTYNPQSIISHLFLAETLVDLGRREDAKTELRAATPPPLDPDWTPEDRRFKQQAEQLLAKLK